VTSHKVSAECARSAECGCTCHKPGMNVAHITPCCDLDTPQRAPARTTPRHQIAGQTDLYGVVARSRAADALRLHFRNSLKVEPSGAEWIETGTHSVHLAELALRLVDAIAGDSDEAIGGVNSSAVADQNRASDGVSIDDTYPSCQITNGQRVWFVEGAEPEDDRLLLTDEHTGNQVSIDHTAWNALLGAVAYFQEAHCEACPNVSLAEPNDFVLIPGLS
jgi:hypothetical protein